MAVGVERLQALSLFSTLSDDELAAVGRSFEHRTVSPGSRLTVEGASGYSFFVIEDGVVEVERDGELLTTLGPGDFSGEMAILSGRARSQSSAPSSRSRASLRSRPPP